jgi:hypothetical protein
MRLLLADLVRDDRQGQDTGGGEAVNTAYIEKLVGVDAFKGTNELRYTDELLDLWKKIYVSSLAGHLEYHSEDEISGRAIELADRAIKKLHGHAQEMKGEVKAVIADEIKEHMLDIIWELRRGTCWCEMAVDNPMASEHNKFCVAAARAMLESGKPDHVKFARQVLSEAWH